MGKTNQIDKHPKRDEILRHLINKDIQRTEIVDKYDNYVEGGKTYTCTYDALNWYIKTHLKDGIKDFEEERVEIVNEELRKLNYKYSDLLDALLANIKDEIAKGTFKISSVTALTKVIDLVTRLKGEQSQDVHIYLGWGTKFDESPRFEEKGVPVTMKDLNLEEYR